LPAIEDFPVARFASERW